MNAPDLDRIVRAHVIAPHPDDEAIGAFGLIAALRARGTVVDVTLVTDGGASHRESAAWPRARLRDTRYRETRRVLRRAGIRRQDLRFLGYPDGDLGFAGPAMIAPLARDLARRPRPDLIVTPSVNDNHADHRAVAAAVKRAWPASIPRLSYLVWPRLEPHRPRPRGRNQRLPLRGRAAMKQAALTLYRSQFGQLVDDADGFTIGRDLRVRFGHPVERFGSQP
ncbi:PIG-L family deacetylase [Salinisphaera sp.]|uniref:PIG-L deacetylase family protein n=1 Tax=Salinisphaera sp. TaxID=1914330 RepID=UPI000C424D68|nr:PIG-L family deacetylase [Salinisphaera sp.]MBS64397.1 GlcNAc-PI de-N-acetylase [Salinisphaera sp.]